MTKNPSKTQEAPDLPNDDVLLVGEDVRDLAEPSDAVERTSDFAWDEGESEALRQARKDAGLT
ncbi:MAG: hypothetical protein ACRDSH_25540, partial [Pseudonocardiaceae bacterium]